VVRWSALAGTSGANLAAVATVARSGFETAIRLPGKFTALRIRGIDATGATLTTTGLIKL